MRRLRWTLFVVILALPGAAPAALAQAQKRFALLIGNQGYSDETDKLDNPHDDIARLEKALENLRFDVRTVIDAGFAALQVAVNAHTRRVRAALIAINPGDARPGGERSLRGPCASNSDPAA